MALVSVMDARTLAVAVLGRDRPGIVAGVTGILTALGCNLEDVATSILRGQFAMMLVLSIPAGFDAAQVESALASFAGPAHLKVSVWEIPEGHTESVPTHALTVYGPDRIGIVHEVAHVLAARGANICDMSCRLHEGERAVYVVTLELVVPGDADELDRDLGSALVPLGLEHSLREIARDVL